MFGFTKEESRVSIIAAASASFGSLFGAAFGLWGTYAKFAEDKKVQMEATRSRAYTQLKGQQAEFFVILQQLSLADDKATFYQVRAAQQSMVRGNTRREAQQAKRFDYQGSYLSDALQQERNSEHYGDELVTCSEKMFESIGLIQLSFPPDAVLNEDIAKVESMLTTGQTDIFPIESLRDRALWATKLEDAQKEINARQKQKGAYIVRATAPISDLLTYLQERIRSNAR